MRRREPPKEKTNLGPPLSYTAVAGLLRALRGIRAAPNRPARFADPAAPTGPTRYYTPETMIALAQRLERLAAQGSKARIAVTPETANVWARALRAYAARPTYDDVLQQCAATRTAQSGQHAWAAAARRT
jgi:hypothetical protein